MTLPDQDSIMKYRQHWWRRLFRKQKQECPLEADFRKHGIKPLTLPKDRDA